MSKQMGNNGSNGDEKLLTIKEVSNLLKVSDDFVRKLIRKEVIVSIRVGNRHRIARQEVRKYLDGQKKEE